jgi:hypothetical protein
MLYYVNQESVNNVNLKNLNDAILELQNLSFAVISIAGMGTNPDGSPRLIIHKASGRLVPLRQDWAFWLYSGIAEELSAISLLLNSYCNASTMTFRPILTLMRPIIEKYADIMNFLTYSWDYERYLFYLSELSNVSGSQKKKIQEDNEPSLKTLFKTDIINRKTRYYLLGTVNKRYDDSTYWIADFNKNLAFYDGKLSSVLHNNLQKYPKSTLETITEVINNITIIVHEATLAIKEYEGLEDTQFFSDVLSICVNIKNRINQIK